MHISVKFDTMVASVDNFLVQEWRNVSNDTPEGTVLLGHFPLQYCDYIVEMFFFPPLARLSSREMSSWETKANSIKG